MTNATITLWGSYKYKINLSEGMSMSDVAMEIALEVHKTENKTRFTGHPRSYNYIYECLLRKSCFNFRLNTEDNKNNEQELLKAANDLNSKTEFIKKECSCCDFRYVDVNCPKCNGHGYVYEKQEYRLGYTQANTLIIDVDGADQDNLIRVKEFYEMVLNCKFKVFRTGNGYWLFSDKKYNSIEDWIYDHCRVLCPVLQRYDLNSFVHELLALDRDETDKFKRATPDIIKQSSLCQIPHDIKFDVAFTFLSIKRQRSTIRITKKSKDDKIEEVIL